MTDPSAPCPPYKDAEWCRARYFDEGKTLREIADEAGCGLRTVARWFKTHGIQLPTAQEKARERETLMRGEKSGRWKGGPPKCACGNPRSYYVTRCLACRTKAYRGEGNPKWRGDRIGYAAAHDRVKAIHGSASTHSCRHCTGPAAHWAYDHTDPSEKHDPDEGTYSTDPARYMPLCASCHRRFDNAHRRNATP